MDHINELIVILNRSFNWNKARVSCFAKMLLALLTTRTVNLNKIACSMSSEAEQTSRYRRLQRFFAEFIIDFEMIAGFIFRLFFVTDGQWYLTMDRTNWQWGKSNIIWVLHSKGLLFRYTGGSLIKKAILIPKSALY